MVSTNDNGSAASIVTLFLGAGASQFAGYYTFRTFDRLLLNPHVRAQQELPELDRDTERFLAEVRQALKGIPRPTTHDNYLWLLNNYRDFCKKFKIHSGVQRRFERIFAQINPFSDAIEHVMKEITYTTLHHYGTERAQTPTQQEVRRFYLQLAELNFSQSSHLPIFTTNYDLFLDNLLGVPPRDEQIPLVTGIPGINEENARWSSELFTRSDLAIHLYRLHGCVAWFYHGPQDPNVYFHRPPPNLDWNNNLCVMFPGREIFPGKDPHGFAFRKMLQAFLSSGVIAFIGFSFRDDDVVNCLLTANAVRRKPMRIVVVDPYLNDDDIFGALREITTRMTHPFSIPSSSQVRFLDIRFGDPGSCAKILRSIKEELENG